jgi:hypothetical protein
MLSRSFPLLLWLCVSVACTTSTPDQSSSTSTKVKIVWDPPMNITKEEVEQILGEASSVGTEQSYLQNEVKAYMVAYTALTKDTVTDRLGNIYYMIEQYPTLELAHREYDSIRKGNEHAEGFKLLSGVGDEAYFHSDQKNFLFLLMRKNLYLLRLKVNKITSNTNRDAFLTISENLVR